MTNFLVVATRTDIRAISLDVNYHADVVIPVGAQGNVVAADVDRVTGQCLMHLALIMVSLLVLWSLFFFVL